MHVMVNKHSKSTVIELTRHLNPDIVSFFERSKKYYKYEFQDIESFVWSILNEKVTDRTIDIKIIAAKETESRKKRRKDWVAKSKKNYETVDVSNPESFYYRLANDVVYDPQKCIEKYGTADLDIIIQNLIKLMEEWRVKSDLLIKFPNFPYIGKKINVSSIFKSDLTYDIYQIIIREYNGDISFSSIKSPYGVESLFSAEKGYVPVEVQEDGSRKVALYGDSLIIEKLTSSFTDDTLRVFDEKDRLILSFLINNAHVDLKNPSALHAVYATTLTEISKYVLGKQGVVQSQKQDVANRLKRLTETVSAKSDGGYYRSIVVVDSIEIFPPDENGRVEIQYTLGSAINNALITNRIQSLPKSVYMSLTESYSRSLYSRLQLERITLSFQHQTTKSFTFDYFKRIMLIRSKNVSRIRKAILSALEEVKQSTDVISDYVVNGVNIEIIFNLMGEEELNEVLNDDALRIEEKP